MHQNTRKRLQGRDLRRNIDLDGDSRLLADIQMAARRTPGYGAVGRPASAIGTPDGCARGRACSGDENRSNAAIREGIADCWREAVKDAIVLA